MADSEVAAGLLYKGPLPHDNSAIPFLPGITLSLVTFVLAAIAGHWWPRTFGVLALLCFVWCGNYVRRNGSPLGRHMTTGGQLATAISR